MKVNIPLNMKIDFRNGFFLLEKKWQKWGEVQISETLFLDW